MEKIDMHGKSDVGWMEQQELGAARRVRNEGEIEPQKLEAARKVRDKGES